MLEVGIVGDPKGMLMVEQAFLDLVVLGCLGKVLLILLVVFSCVLDRGNKGWCPSRGGNAIKAYNGEYKDPSEACLGLGRQR